MKPLLFYICIVLSFQDVFLDNISTQRVKRQLYRDDIPIKPRPIRPGAEEKDKADAEKHSFDPQFPENNFSQDDVNHSPQKNPTHIPGGFQEHDFPVHQGFKPIQKPSPHNEEHEPIFQPPSYEEHEPIHKPQVYEEHEPIHQPPYEEHKPIQKPAYKPNPVYSKPQNNLGLGHFKPSHKPQPTYGEPHSYERPVHYQPLPIQHETKPIYKPKPSHQHTYKPKPAYEEPLYKPKYPKDIKSSGIPGQPGKDYPIYNEVPHTSFSCKEVPFRPGMYVNTETDCQAYHVCHDERHGPQGAAFLCTNGTLFNQRTFNCDWWYNVDCSNAKSLYGLNSDPKFNPYYKKPYEEEIPYSSPSKTPYKAPSHEKHHGRETPLLNYNPQPPPKNHDLLYTVSTHHKPQHPRNNPLAKSEPSHPFSFDGEHLRPAVNKQTQKIESFSFFEKSITKQPAISKPLPKNEPIHQFDDENFKPQVAKPKPFHRPSVFQDFGPHEIKTFTQDKPIFEEPKPTVTFRRPSVNKDETPPRRIYKRRRPAVAKEEIPEDLSHQVEHKDEPEGAYKSPSSGPHRRPIAKNHQRQTSSYKSRVPLPQRRERPIHKETSEKPEYRSPIQESFENKGASEDISHKLRDSDENVPDENIDFEWGKKI